MKGPSPPGFRSIERSFALLRWLSVRGAAGWRLSDLADRSGLPLGTTHRILSALVREGFAIQQAGSTHYLLGPRAGELAASLPGWLDFPARAREVVATVSRRCEAVAFVFVRSGADFVCIARDGEAGIRALSIEPGTRRPLSASAGGAAMLAAMPRAAARGILAANLRELASYGSRRQAAVRRMVLRSLQVGYGLNLGEVVPGVHACAVALVDELGDPVASVTIAGPAHGLPQARIESLLPVLRAGGQALWPIPGARTARADC